MKQIYTGYKWRQMTTDEIEIMDATRRMIDFAIVEALEQHYKTADGYVKQLESKRIKLPRDRKAIHYWEGQRNAFDRAIYLTTLYEVSND